MVMVPFSPLIVMLDPAVTWKLGMIVTVIMFDACRSGLCCAMICSQNIGGLTRRGSCPVDMLESLGPGVAMVLMGPGELRGPGDKTVHEIFTTGAGWVVEGFCK